MFVQATVDYIVGDSYNNPKKIDDEISSLKIKNLYFQNIPNLSHRFYNRFLNILPPETIFCRTFDNKFYISVPIISSHLSLPVKKEEMVWIYNYEKEANKKLDQYKINSYYLGRCHGLLPTEDTAYCFSKRDDDIFNIYNENLLDSIEMEVAAGGVLEAIEWHSFKENNKKLIYDSNTFAKNRDSSILSNARDFDVYKLDSNHRLVKKATDTVLQGSHNTCINLTNDEFLNYKNKDTNNDYFSNGKVEIIAGLKQNLKRNNTYTSDSFTNVDLKSNITSKSTFIKRYEDFGTEIFNGKFNESIKSDDFFINKEQEEESILGDIVNFSNNFSKTGIIGDDMSKFVVSSMSIESEILKRKYYYDFNDITNNVLEKKLNSNIKDADKKFNINYPNRVQNINDSKSYEKEKLSSIVGQADSITFCTHETYNGEICLIKPSAKDSLSSQIKINKEGNIFIDGNRILIGNYNRLKEKDNGLNAMIYLGESQESQSIVLGEQLKAFTLEMLDIKKNAINTSEKLFQKSMLVLENLNKEMSETFKKNIGTYNSELAVLLVEKLIPLNTQNVPIPGNVLGSLLNNIISGVSNKLSKTILDSIDTITINNNKVVNEYKEMIDKANFKSNQELTLRIEKINDNIDKILSKFVKTS